jgi:hypothetical protein
MSGCLVDGCERKLRCKGYCGPHYSRFRRHGDPLAGTAVRDERLQQTFLRMIEIETDDCVIWPYPGDNGYGRIKFNGSRTYVHSMALKIRVGDRPPGMDAAHGPCHNRACINYRHLRWATRSENVNDMFRDGTVCRGERRPHSKLTESLVLEIRRRVALGEKSVPLAHEYGVSETTVRDIARRRRWGWLA